jgi:uncharacterized heparinase superfamily protein
LFRSGNISLYINTARYLRPAQVFYQALNRVRRIRRTKACFSAGPSEFKTAGLHLSDSISSAAAYENGSFTFLNRSHVFGNEIDWNFSEYGPLWCYHLNYFEWLNRDDMHPEKALRFISHFISTIEENKTALEPAPTAIRTINWIKFIIRHGIRDDSINGSLYFQARHLSKNLEYHLLGNHLLEDAFGLLFASYYFGDESLYSTARRLLTRELEEQILPDGAHFELSPMYHQIMLYRVLDSLNLVRNNDFFRRELMGLLSDKASLMLGWLDNMTFRNGEIPLLNDSAFRVAPTTGDLFDYASRLGIGAKKVPLKESGYRKAAGGDYEAVIDVGNIGPDYIPGHAHSDTFNFVLHLAEKPFIVDTGTSTYERGELRLSQRKTSAHNTVQVDGLDQSEVWGSFRVARRARVRDLKESGDRISATHDGYKRIGAIHKRVFEFGDKSIIISDEVISSGSHNCKAFIHFHPEISPELAGSTVTASGKRIVFTGAAGLLLKDYAYAPEFNKLVPAKLVEVSFSGSLKTEIFL